MPTIDCGHWNGRRNRLPGLSGSMVWRSRWGRRFRLPVEAKKLISIAHPNPENGYAPWATRSCRWECYDAAWDTESVPTVLRSGPYRVYFYSHEPNESPHVHVDRDDLSAKFWLEPVGLARNFGFSPKELRRIQNLVIQHQATLLEAWHGHFGAGG